MYADKVVNLAMVRKVNTFLNQIYHFHKNQNDNVHTFRETNISSVRLLDGNL